ncbi:hypothetical protein G7Y89_g12310 [Cudoniella acicularis]|uniref:Heterokaryon incompatibility domain-containing protein n=1 Tax=Cudoniella acicularis TaxID=354080 RepID=A0A8H4RBS2_9HELO|nr:hypothetical protein G7Y89_g12310 [Cudoniella acicularis]
MPVPFSQALRERLESNSIGMVMGLRAVGGFSRRAVIFHLVPSGDGEPYRLRSKAANTTKSDESWALAMKWIEDCTTHHTKCNAFRPSEGWFPSRLIDIGTSEDCEPRLRITIYEPPDGPYVTLSHCWGKALLIQLKGKYLRRFAEGIPMSDLPKTFVDAICITRRLGFRYIWIDSLCIIQDSKEDWIREALSMDKVYSNSICNIAATASRDSSQGLFRERPVHTLYPCEVDVIRRSDGQAVRHHILDTGFWKEHLGDQPLNQRGWVLQERFLAPRVLHFGFQLMWECQELDAAEKYPVGLPEDLKPSACFKSLEEEPRMKPWNGRWEKSHSHNIVWNKIMRTYSRTALTKPEDKLIALSGIAKMLQVVMEDEYIAGMWKRHFAGQLLWRVDTTPLSNGVLASRPKEYRAPSFSWLSIDGPVGFISMTTDEGNIIEILDIDIEPSTSDSTGPIKAGYIRIRGTLKPLELKRSNDSFIWNMIVDGKLLVINENNPREKRRVPLVFMDIHQDEFSGEMYIMCISSRESPVAPMVGGLILEPTRVERGEFRRLGTFTTGADVTFHGVLLGKAENGERLPCEAYHPVSCQHTITIV